MAAKKDKMIPSEKERKRALKYATPAGTGRMWVTMGIAFIIFGIILLLIPIGLAISEASAQRYDPESIHTATLVFYLLGAFFGFCGCFCVTMFLNIKIVEAIRKEYPAGTRVRLVKMDDIQAPPLGTEGTVVGVDDTGSLLMHWDNGSHLNIVYGSDEVEKV